MTMNTPPYVLQASSHSAQLFRQAISTLLGSAGGVVGSGDLLVTQNGTPNMSINVAGGPPGSGGGIWVPGTTSSGVQGQYFGYQDATVNLAIATSNPSNPRIDTPIVQVQDAAYAGAVNSITLSVLTGTPAASPVAPTVPASSLPLANIAVAAAATSVVTANITDRRSRMTLGAASAPSVVVTALPTSPVDGQIIYFQTAAMIAAGIGPWVLRFRSASVFAYKWEAVGASPLRQEIGTPESTSSTTYANLTTAGPAVTLPLAGDYDVAHGFEVTVSSNGGGNLGSFATSAAASDADRAFSGGVGTCSRTVRKTGLTAGASISAQYRVIAGTAGTFSNRWLAVSPIRVG